MNLEHVREHVYLVACPDLRLVSVLAELADGLHLIEFYLNTLLSFLAVFRVEDGSLCDKKG